MSLSRAQLQEPVRVPPTVAAYRVTYRIDPPGEFGDCLFVVKKEISRYTPQDPHDWLSQTKSDWVGKKVISVERVD